MEPPSIESSTSLKLKGHLDNRMCLLFFSKNRGAKPRRQLELK
jgi:hypothetical protein